MAWHGFSKTDVGKVFLTEQQQLVMAKLAEDSEYWDNAQGFVKSVDGHELTSLTRKQLDWYNDIDAKLAVEVDRYEARIAFGQEKEHE